MWPESETWTHKTLDGEFDAYMCGLGGKKTEHYENPSVWYAF